MTSKVTHDIIENANGFIWKILAIKDTETQTKNLFVDRNRIGALVSPVYSFNPDMPLVLYYTSGSKKDKYIQHSRIVEVSHSGNTVKVSTTNTMYHLELVGKPL